MIISLPWKDRKVMAEVANLYCDIALKGPEDRETVRTFWRISMYSKIGLLSRKDAQDIHTAMEAFCKLYRDNPEKKDPNGIFADVENVAARLKTLLDKKKK